MNGVVVSSIDVSGLREVRVMSVPELRAELIELRRIRAVVDARVVDIVARLEASMTAVGTHERGIPEVELVAHGGMTRREAADAVRRAHVIESAPVVGKALASGTVTAGHVDAISRGVKIAGDSRERFLDLLPSLMEDVADKSVPEFAAALMKAAKGLVSDGGLSVFEDQRRSTYLRVWNDAAGMVQMRGAFDPEIGALVQSRLHAQVETMFHAGDREVPIVHHPWIDANDFRRAHALTALVRGDHDERGRSDGRDDRAPGSRSASSESAKSRFSGSRTASSGGSCRSDVVVHIDLETLTSGLSASSTHRTSFGADLPVETIRRISCDAHIIPLVLNSAGMPLDIGRGQRLASAAQRRALEAAHDTCGFDGCAVAFHACQIHHIEYWERGGSTDLDNMVPLCSRHHHAAHEGGWRLRIQPGTRTLVAKPPGSSP